MMGQKVRSGTGLADILLDEDELSHLLQETEAETIEYDMVDETNIHAYLEGDDLNDDDGCDLDDFKFSFE